MPIKLTLNGQGLLAETSVGAGATSVVWRCRRISDDLPCALKVARRPSDYGILAEEGERLLWAQSAALPVLLGAGRLKGADADALGATVESPALLLSWIDGVPLGTFLQDFRDTEQLNREGAVLQIALRLAHAIGDLHACGIAHGDIKPDNVLVQVQAGRLAASLVDFGLGGAADTQVPRGGTRRYFAPEVTNLSGEGDGRKRDLFALGVILSELWEPRMTRVPANEIASQLTTGSPVERMILPLLSPFPSARPSADWVSSKARLALLASKSPSVESPSEELALRLGRIRRAYLNVRKDELRAAARCERFQSQLGGHAHEFTVLARERLRAIDALRAYRSVPSKNEEPCVLGHLDHSRRLRFLVELIGPTAASWPCDAIADDDDVLLSRLIELSERTAPHAVTLAQLSRGSAADVSSHLSSPVELTLLLAEGSPRNDVLDAAEAYATTAQSPVAFRLAVGRRLRALGEYGRALSVLDVPATPVLLAEAAETLRRAGDRDGALARLTQLSDTTSKPARVRCRATEARLMLDRGDIDRALSILSDVEETATVLEVRALAELAGNRRDSALETLSRAAILATNDEERARIESLKGMLHHAEQQAPQAIESFRRAVEYAARMGSVLEEATYLTGLSAAAVDGSRIEEAILAAERATALFEALGRKRDAARAALNRVAALVAVGAVAQAKAAGDLALSLARQARDDRCAAYVHLELADILEADREGQDHAESAMRQLSSGGADERLMAAARAHLHAITVDVEELDALARQSVDTQASCIDWWGARARVALRNADLRDASSITGQLCRLLECNTASSRRGKAIAAGVNLALLADLGDTARRLHAIATSDAQKLVSGCPAELRPSLLGLAWIRALRVPSETPLSQGQIADIESLVRALGRAEQLRPLLVQVLDALVLWTGVERGLLLLQAPGGKLVPRVGRNLGRTDLVGHQLSLSHSLAARALEQGEPLVAVDASGELESIHESVHALKLRSVLAVPLIARGEALGVVYLDDRVRRGAFGAKELAWVRLVGTVAAVAIADARDRLRLRRAARRAERAELRSSTLLAKRETELGVARIELARSRQEVPTRYRYGGIIGDSQAMRTLLRLVDRVVTADIPVLVLGESGTGKELIARAIHQNSARAKAEFVAENCGALPEPLLESTLFGHVKGAFTGASRAKAGLFEVAHEGTLFLDEVAEMSLAMQTKLLRVLEEGEFWPVGSEHRKRVDVRVIAATHRDLEAMVSTGAFRQDLYYRLNVVSLKVPPLRERHGDVPLLVEHFLSRYSKDRGIKVTKETLELLSRYAWPGNVRQLENELRRAIVLSDTVIEPHCLSDELRKLADDSQRVPIGLSLHDHIEVLERRLLATALERTNGNQTRAAELLGVSRFGLQKMLRRLDIKTGESRSEPEKGPPSGTALVRGVRVKASPTSSQGPRGPGNPGNF